MSKRKCPIENCCNADCHQSQKEILECQRRNKIIGIFDANQQNQKAIECLKEVKECFLSGVLMFDINADLTEREQDTILYHYEEDKRILADIIDTKIKELEEGK